MNLLNVVCYSLLFTMVILGALPAMFPPAYVKHPKLIDRVFYCNSVVLFLCVVCKILMGP